MQEHCRRLFMLGFAVNRRSGTLRNPDGATPVLLGFAVNRRSGTLSSLSPVVWQEVRSECRLRKGAIVRVDLPFYYVFFQQKPPFFQTGGR